MSSFFNALANGVASALAAEAARQEHARRVQPVSISTYTVMTDGYGNQTVVAQQQPKTTGNVIADRLQSRIDALRARNPNARPMFHSCLSDAEKHLDRYLLKGDDHQANQCATKISDAEFFSR